MGINIQNPPKALVAVLLIICITVLLSIHAIDQAAGMGPMGIIVGYIVGNGVTAKQGKDMQPIVGQSDHVTE